mgnify:CR=1 FL=1
MGILPLYAGAAATFATPHLARSTEALLAQPGQKPKRIIQVVSDGMSVGTPAYMIPEQAVGDAVDARSDIFSFGAVLYEMVTGARAFRGDSRMSTLAAVLKDEPKPPSQIAVGLPREVENRRIYFCSPEYLTEYAKRYVSLGAGAIGGAELSGRRLGGLEGAGQLAIVSAAAMLAHYAGPIAVYLPPPPPPRPRP